MRLACIGVGSNAIRLLEASCRDGEPVTVRRERRGTRLFAGLVGGRLTQQSIDTSVEAVAELARIAREDGVRELYAFATSAVRDAVNGEEFTRRAEEACGSRVEIISGEQEAVLSYLGAAHGGSAAVIDIGGGSTEFTLGEDETILGAVSLQMGAVRMHGLRAVLTQEDYKQTREMCMRMIRRDAEKLLAMPRRGYWVGVGGTMTTLGAMERGVPLFDADRCEGMRISRERVSRWGEQLAVMSPEMRRQVAGLMPQRADIIPSGLAILDAAMRVFDVKEIELSAHGNMDGFLKKKFQKKG